MKKFDKKKTIGTVIMIIFLTIALVAIYISAYQSFSGNRSKQEFEEIEMLISSACSKESEISISISSNSCLLRFPEND